MKKVTRNQVVEIARKMRINLEDWQLDIIFDRKTKKYCLNCGRKRGKTTTFEFRYAVMLLNGECPGEGLSGGIAITSYEMRSVRQIVSFIKAILVAFGWKFTKYEEHISEVKMMAFGSTTEIRMPNKSRLMGFPRGSSGDNMRPFSFKEKWDDECDIDTPYEYFDSTNPCLAVMDGVEALTSTPNPLGDRQTYFAEAFFGTRPGYKVYHMPSDSAPHISKAWLDYCKQTWTRQKYEREILALFSSDLSLVFPGVVINQCMAHPILWDDLRENNTTFLGVRYARFDTETSVIAENIYKDSISHIRISVIGGLHRRIMGMEDEIVSVVEANTSISKIVIDNTTLGQAPIDALADRIGHEKVVGVAAMVRIHEIEGERSRYMKEDLYVQLLQMMERGLVRFEDRRIQAAMLDCKYKYSKTGKVTIIGNDIMEAACRSVFPLWGRNEYFGKINSNLFKPIKL